MYSFETKRRPIFLAVISYSIDREGIAWGIVGTGGLERGELTEHKRKWMTGVRGAESSGGKFMTL